MPTYMKVLRLVKGVTRTDRVCNANIYESAEISKRSNQNRQGMQCQHIYESAEISKGSNQNRQGMQCQHI